MVLLSIITLLETPQMILTQNNNFTKNNLTLKVLRVDSLMLLQFTPCSAPSPTSFLHPTNQS